MHYLDATLNYLAVGHWMHARGFALHRPARTREDIFRTIADTVRGTRVLYLEFGVLRGESLRCWSGLLDHPDSRLVGFDSFQGLPEDWTRLEGIGSYSTHGDIPVIDDPRVELRIGWFNETLPRFELTGHDHLIINLDADLYSSTKTVLDHLGSVFHSKTFVYFDEFCNRNHELRAFDEFLRSSGRSFELMAATRAFAHVAFRCVA